MTLRVGVFCVLISGVPEGTTWRVCACFVLFSGVHDRTPWRVVVFYKVIPGVQGRTTYSACWLEVRRFGCCASRWAFTCLRTVTVNILNFSYLASPVACC